MAVDQKVSKWMRKHGPARDRFLLAQAQAPHECNPNAIEGEDHGQCAICGAWVFLDCDGHWQRYSETKD